jgi:hypothetical protein
MTGREMEIEEEEEIIRESEGEAEKIRKSAAALLYTF